MICWHCFGWDAFATLTTGALVVIGATWVGLRQTKILGRQVRLSELTLRKDLFEKRAAVYEATSEYIGFILREADYPDRAREIAYVHAMGQSRFLFPLAVHAALDEIYLNAIEIRSLKKQGDVEGEHKLHRWMYERFTTLPDIFGDEMRLA